MTDVRIASDSSQPIHGDGAVSTVALSEGQLVGFNSDGEIILADAASGTAEPAVGVVVQDVDDDSTYPTGQFEVAAKLAESERTLINQNKVGYVRFGVEIVNEDADWSWTPGEPVYLASSDDSGDSAGDFTDTAPAGSSEIVQVVGSVGPDGESVFLGIQADYTTNA